MNESHQPDRLSNRDARHHKRDERFLLDSHHRAAPSNRGTTIRLIRYRQRREITRVNRYLRRESIGGALIIFAAVLGFFLANSPWAESYFTLKGFKIGPESLGLRLDLAHWAADALLAIFFFVVGLELKHEFMRGDLRKFSTAIVPVSAAIGGVAVPALIYFAFNAGTDHSHGWAIPTATDIAFAVAILGLVAPRIPAALRMFLLTLAVVDDLIAIVIIAIFYSTDINLVMLGLAVIPIALYAILTRVFTQFFVLNAWAAWVILLPLGGVAWAFFLNSGIHATIAGVLLAFMVPAAGPKGRNLAEKLAFRYQPLSAGVAVPIFAFFSAGVAVGGESRFPFDPIAYGVMAGLVLGKPIGIALTTWVVTAFTKATLGSKIDWLELTGVASLAGVGFTVSLLISELSFKTEAEADTARLAVMVGSLIAVLLSTVVFQLARLRSKRQWNEELEAMKAD